jgi:class 3 adenylate cyclase/tetratricopeptide (TPR) repeat protein
MTVVFCDLVGSTQLSMAIDPEDYTAIVRAYRDMSVSVIRNWNGYVARFVGDGLLIYFGYPTASEDDAFRAVCAACQLTESIPLLDLSAIGAPADARIELPLSVRIGVHTGLALVGEMISRESKEVDAVLGAAPNIAAKLQTLARPGEIIISDATAELLPSSVKLTAANLSTAQASAMGVKAYSVSESPDPVAKRRSMSCSCFVGRDALISRVLSGMANAHHNGANYLLIGEAGIGKSRCVQEVIRHPITASYLWVEVACHPLGQASPLHPFRTLLAQTRDEAEKAGALLDEPTSDLSPFQRRRRSFEELTNAIMSRGPNVGIVLEDIHWADPTTLEFVGECLVASTNRHPWLMTSRSLPSWNLTGFSTLSIETLDSLLPGEAAEVAKATAGPNFLTAFQLAEIVDRADGNPLFIEEFVRAVLNPDAAPDKNNPGHIPSTLRDSLTGRLDGLGIARKVALYASVLGRQFEYKHLRELCDVAEPELINSLRALTDAGILLNNGTIPEAAFEFRHALLRDVAYQTLLKSDRQRLHRRVAELVRSGIFGDIGPRTELLAIHHSLGGNLAEAIGWWLRAGRDAVKRSANAEALDHLTKGLADCRKFNELKPIEASRAELELLSALPAPLIAVSGWSSAELQHVYTSAAKLCEEFGSEEARFQLERGRFNLHLLKSEISEADTIADQLVALAQQTPDKIEREARFVESLRTKALVEFYRANYPAARSLLEQMIEIYDPDRHAVHAYQHGAEPAAVALSYLAWMDSIDGKYSSSKDRLERALEHSKSVSHAFSMCYVHCFAASCGQLWGDSNLAAVSADKAIRLANENNFEYWLAWGKALRGWARGLHEPRLGVQDIDDACAAYLMTGSTLIKPYFEALACNLTRLENMPGATEREENIRASTEATGVQFWRSALADQSHAKRPTRARAGAAIDHADITIREC